MWEPSYELIAQLGHFGWGALFVLVGARLHHYEYGLAAMLLWAVPKEFIFDKYVEKADDENNFRDFASYAFGALAAVVFVLWTA